MDGLKCEVSKFADDMKFAYKITFVTLRGREALQSDTDQSTRWVSRSQIKLTIKKPKVLHIVSNNNQ